MQPLPSDDSEIHSIQQWPIQEIKYAEWRSKFDESVFGDWAALGVGLVTESDDRFVCDLKFHMGERGLGCGIWMSGQDAVPITKGNTPLQSSTWHIVRISVIDDPLGFQVYLDDQPVVLYVVENPEPWKSNKIHIYSTLGGDNIKSAITTHIDYAVVTGK
jgi:hypothetical protein